MPAPYVRLSSDTFAALLARFPFRRRIDSVHLHHTWRPRQCDYQERDTIVAMANHHTQVNRWSDIAQHVSIGPEGAIWTGRDWNQPPASASGYNGNRVAGPFMIEMIGDFDEGRDRLEGAQRKATIDVIARVQLRFGLAPESLRFHNTMSSKSCPGTSVHYEEVLAEVVARRREIERDERRAARGAEASKFGEDALFFFDFVEACAATRSVADDAPAGEPDEESMSSDEQRRYDATSRVVPAPVSARAARGPADKLTPDVLHGLRPHVVNMTQGQFAASGKYASTAGDVDALFDQHLERALESATAAGKPLRLMFYAHGGLVNEASGLWMAHRLIPWWLGNGIYPVYFVWETGLMETLGQMLRGAKRTVARAGARDVFDVTTDPILERLVRVLRGDLVWGGMKRSAELASQPGGAAHYVAQRLAQFCSQHPDVELHGAGHSAGSIFHAHFIPAALDMGVPAFRSLSLLAPAIRVDTFHDKLTPRLENGGIRRLDLFTMARDWELNDNCMVYRKSLLYLIHYGLEAERKTPILGLEVSLREDPKLRALLGLDGGASPRGSVHWSKSVTTSGWAATCSTSHGGFDNDAPTLASVARRIIGHEHCGLAAFPSDAAADRSTSTWPTDVELPDDLDHLAVAPSAQPDDDAIETPVLEAYGATAVPPHAGGRRRALCIGIDAYESDPLSGCVADAEAWREALAAQGFEVKMLTDARATRAAILKAIGGLIRGSRSGDVVAIQYSGHGTQLPDLDADERLQGDAKDEAICPVDCDSGAFIVDDEIAEIFADIPDGVNVTCFMDCCHSGTISRFAVGAPDVGRGKMRYMRATPARVEAYRQYRGSRATRAPARPAPPPARRRAVVFSACRSSELAWEHDGHGDFTRHATPLLAASIGQASHRAFAARVVKAFGSRPRQHPELDCTPALADLVLLQALAPAAAVDDGRAYGAIPPTTAAA